MNTNNYDFSGWATKNNLKCSDGRIIGRDAFKENDGETVPLVWNHQHNDPLNVLGHAVLENRENGVYAYCTLNDTEAGRTAKELIEHGDVDALSIYANGLKQKGPTVMHGKIREVSLVLAGANPGAYIDSVIRHGEDSEDEGVIYTGEYLELSHSDDRNTNPSEVYEEKEKREMSNNQQNNDETVEDVLNTMTPHQQEVVKALIGKAIQDTLDGKINPQRDDEDNEGDEEMKHNVFDQNVEPNNTLSHADEMAIIETAKSAGCGSLQDAIRGYIDDNYLQHDAFDDMTQLFPDYKLIDPAEPDILYDDDSWVNGVINGVRKSPIARVRTRKADARQAEIKAKGYEKGKEKTLMGHIQLLGRTHDAQTIYVRDTINRDDILDITDFDVINYQWKIMRHSLEETIATAILVGDGRDLTDVDKIKEDHLRPIWKDDDLYCIHADVDIDAAKKELQGTNTGANFGENYVYAEAIISAALTSREKYKGSGNLTFYCTPHLLNVMLLARDLNGRRIYTSKADLVAALNVKDIVTIEQFEGLTRTTSDSKTKKMLGLFVNLSDYQLGCVKGGEITKFDQFDIKFNQQLLLLETRLSGALVEWYSAIALEEDITAQG